MATTPTLASYTLPPPTADGGYKVKDDFRGYGSTMADGSVVFDLVNASVKRTFTLRWNALTATERGTIETAFGAIKNASGAFVGPDGTSCNVTRDPSNQSIEFEAYVVAGGALRYRAELTLREV